MATAMIFAVSSTVLAFNQSPAVKAQQPQKTKVQTSKEVQKTAVKTESGTSAKQENITNTAKNERQMMKNASGSKKHKNTGSKATLSKNKAPSNATEKAVKTQKTEIKTRTVAPVKK